MFPRLEKEGGSQCFAITLFCGQALSVDIFGDLYRYLDTPPSLYTVFTGR